MECPICKNEVELFAQLKPDGWIGYFCLNCLETHITKDPEEGWEFFRAYKEARKDLSNTFLDIEYELLALAKYEFDVLVESFYYKVIVACHT